MYLWVWEGEERGGGEEVYWGKGQRQPSFIELLYWHMKDFLAYKAAQLETTAFKEDECYSLFYKIDIKISRTNINNLICRWHRTYSRKQRGTEEPLDESERGEWKSWLETQHLKNENHGIWSHHFMANRWGNSGNSELLGSWAPNHCRW